MKVAIVSGGLIENDFVDAYLKEGFDYLIAADRGLCYFYESHRKPDMILGDFDSVAEDILKYYQQIMPQQIQIFPSQKDETDTELAIYEALKQSPEEIHLLGATGGRMDHFMGTLKNLGLGLFTETIIYLVDSNNRIRMINEGITTLKKQDAFGKYFSIIPYEHSIKGLSITGAKYNVTDCCLEGFISRGVSNEIIDEEARIEIRHGKAYLCESRD